MGKEEDQTNFLRREIAYLKEQHHENIVEWLHTIETTTDLYTSLEFCAGKTIAHLIHNEHQIREPVAQFLLCRSSLLSSICTAKVRVLLCIRIRICTCTVMYYTTHFWFVHLKSKITFYFTSKLISLALFLCRFMGGVRVFILGRPILGKVKWHFKSISRMLSIIIW